jgi:dTDP-4-dehydrorhamnose 3,5-epimerase-like enzyme
MNLDKIKFQSFEDYRGSLVIIEEHKHIPFTSKRIYYIFGVEGTQRRGFHAHKALSQMAFVIQGTCTMLLDDGLGKVNVELNSPKEGLLIGPMVWHEMYDFSDDCILMVCADDFYDESDYIRNYDDFLKTVSEKK